MSRTTTVDKSTPSSPALSREVLTARVLPGIVTALAVGTVVLYVVVLIAAFNFRLRPFFGVMLSQTQIVTGAQSSGGVPWPGIDAGLTNRDRITGVNGQPLAAAPNYAEANAQIQAFLDQASVGTPITVTYERIEDDGSAVTNTVTYPLTQLPDSDFLIYFALPFFSGLIAIAAGVTVLVLRIRQPTALHAAAICFLLAIVLGGFFDLGSTHLLVSVWIFVASLLGGMLVSFGLVFPSALRITYRAPFIPLLPLLITVPLGIFAVSLATNPETHRSYIQGNQLAMLVTVISVLLLAFLVSQQQRFAQSTVTRDQAGMITVGLVLASVPVGLWGGGQVFNLLFGGTFTLPLTLEATTPFAIPPILSLVYAVLQGQGINTDRVLSQSVTYAMLLFGLIVGYFLLTLGASMAALRVVPDDPLIISLTLFSIAVLFVPVRTRIQSMIDTIYYRRRLNFQEISEEFARKLGSVSGYAETIREFKATVTRAISPTHVFVFLPTDEGEEFVAFGDPNPDTDIRFEAKSGVIALVKQMSTAMYLPPGRPFPAEMRVDQSRLSILKATILVGLMGASELNGFVILGPSRSASGEYTYEELRFIDAIMRQLTIAIERAQVINSLEKRVRQLDVLSQVGQAVNFTIAFDDLLELISAQTSRLIDSTHFSIALYDNAVQQLYFAFFLENDERYTDRENKRWNLGNDLFSTVVRDVKPLRVDDYGRAVKESGANFIYDDAVQIKAWMAVPLVAQARVLGVLSAGKSRSSEVYTSEQVKIFSDVAALAATSIDKARLFAEVNVRARQLGALNDISRKLVAAESSDVESLLHLITNSAVEILNAEAGSLLLAAEDGSGDMIFRVAVGGTGADLIGQRLPAGRGLVGEVARSGTPVIVNDARGDARWQGEVTKGGFRTNSVIAAPLIAKDQITGVLEVLNKKDGTTYAQEEVELLTTFAGQAAIAIENARLFEVTGSQLNRRLKELETLERIDVELNRTLDIRKVAEITVRWAVANTGASAGALGVVVESSHLDVLAQQGYDDGSFPEDYNLNRWPLDKGILRRVLRFRVADLVPDVSMDPDYRAIIPTTTSQITVPMLSGDSVNAVLILEKSGDTRLNLLDLDFVQRLAEHASIAILNAQLYEEVREAANTKSEFVGFAAHELKNPLASVKGYAALLQNPAAAATMPPEQQRQWLQVISNNADRMESIINDLRDIAAIEANKLAFNIEPVSLMQALEETLISFEKNVQEKQQTIYNEIPADLPLVMADSKRLIQVLVNLVSNAIKYSPESASVTIRARVDKTIRNQRGQLQPPMVEVAIQDTGIGMSKEDLGKIFREKYFRSENEKARAQKGTGLGMMITQMFVERMGGRIWVESELNVGSTFYFTVPLAPEVPVSEPQTSQVEGEPASD